MFLGVLHFYLLNLATGVPLPTPDCATQRGFPRLAASRGEVGDGLARGRVTRRQAHHGANVHSFQSSLTKRCSPCDFLLIEELFKNKIFLASCKKGLPQYYFSILA